MRLPMSLAGITTIDSDSLQTASDDELLWLHKKLHQAARIGRDRLVEDHLLVVQEMAKRDLEHDGKSNFDQETLAFAVTKLDLDAAELATLQLVNVDKQTTTIQTLILSKEVFKSLDAAKKWIKDHDFKTTHQGKGPDETDTSYRFRQRSPGDFIANSFRTIQFQGTKGVQAVIGRLKKAEKANSTHKVCQDSCSSCGVCSCTSKGEEHTVNLLPIDKADDEQQIVFGIALEPGEVDSQNDTIRPPVIKVAAHNWLAKYQDRGVQHNKIVNSKIEIYESYIAPVNLTIGGQKVKKGSWLLMYHILDKDLWSDIKKGKFTGFSIGGLARRRSPA
jgi:hypothetical protein